MDHHDAHSDNTFCGHAGEQEMKHFHWLLDQVSNAEVAQLVTAGGITFDAGTNPADIDRDTLEGVLDELDREVFYREWHALIAARSQV